MKTIQEMAYEAGLLPCEGIHPKDLEAFAALVRADLYKEMHDPMVLACKKMVADEREECAKVCDDRAFRFFSESPFFVEMHGLADAIRARKEQT